VKHNCISSEAIIIQDITELLKLKSIKKNREINTVYLMLPPSDLRNHKDVNKLNNLVESSRN
jgi:hypothetical protein